MLVLLAIGVADFGRVFYTGIVVANAARAAAEYGARKVETWDSAAANAVGAEEAADIAPVTMTTERFCRCPDGTEPACDGSCPGPYTWTEVFIKTRVQKTLTLFMPYPGLPQTIVFNDSATFRAQ
jgi:Flp pilus assembly protein TadG